MLISTGLGCFKNHQVVTNEVSLENQCLEDDLCPVDFFVLGFLESRLLVAGSVFWISYRKKIAIFVSSFRSVIFTPYAILWIWRDLKNQWYLAIGWWYITYHLLREPETAIDPKHPSKVISTPVVRWDQVGDEWNTPTLEFWSTAVSLGT